MGKAHSYWELMRNDSAQKGRCMAGAKWNETKQNAVPVVAGAFENSTEKVCDYENGI